MASPQTENGYTKIANELVDALTKLRIPGEATQVLFYIFRKTYGFNKVEDAISLSQFALATGLKKSHVCRALDKLELLNLITKKDNDIAHIYRFNKDFETWKALPKKDTSTPKREKVVPQKGKNQYPKKGTTKDSKEIITKDISDVPSQEVQELINEFKNTINPHINFGNKTERKAAEDLIRTYSLQKTLESIKFISHKQGKDKYMPVVTSPYDLWTKWAKLKVYFENKNNPKKNSAIRI